MIVLEVIRTALTIVLAVIVYSLARDLEKAKRVGAGLVMYMERQGLELPPPEVMTQIINSYWEEENT